MIKVLFVCMGNICRSPSAQGVFLDRIEKAGLQWQVFVDSAGTHAYHVGGSPDPRAQEAARRRGVDLSEQKARIVVASDFEEFDYVVPMDADNVEGLQAICPPQFQSRIRLFLDYADGLDESEVPDPYYGGANGFERVLDLIEAASDGLVVDIKVNHLG